MIWPPGKTSIRNRPPLVSSTTFASRSAAPWTMSDARVQAVDMRHWTFGCAMTLGGGSAPGAAALAPFAVARNWRRLFTMQVTYCGQWAHHVVGDLWGTGP